MKRNIFACLILLVNLFFITGCKDKSASNKNLAKNVCANMKKFKNSSRLEQATIGVIVNQLVSVWKVTLENNNRLSYKWKV